MANNDYRLRARLRRHPVHGLFNARAPDGTPVSGQVACGLVLKGCTVRVDP